MKKLSSIVATALALGAVGVEASPLQYTFGFSADSATVSGAIWTDGTIGALANSNISSVSVSVHSGVTDMSFSTSNSGNFGDGGFLFGTSGGLTASAAGLFFDFTGSDKSFWIQGIGTPGFVGLEWAGDGTGCPYGGYGYCVWLNTVAATGYATASGVQQIASVVSEPNSLALLGLGLSAILASRRRKPKTVG